MISCIALAACVMLLPIFRPGMVVTDDGNWMVIRLSAFYQSLREGQFPVRFLGRLNQSYGYPVANFLYPGFLYIGSVLHAIGLPFQSSIEAIIIGSVLIGALFIFLWLKKTYSAWASTIGALSYVFMPYLMFDIFKRGSIGEIFVLGIMPIAMYAISCGYTWLIPPAIFLIIIGHNTLAVFFIPFLLLYIGIRKQWKALVSVFLGIGMAAFFWLPMLVERNLVAFDTTVISNPGAYFSMSNSIILSSVPVIIAAFVVLFHPKMKKDRTTLLFIIAVFGSIFFATKLSAWFWRIAEFVKFIQFPFRFLSYVVIAGPWLVAGALDLMKRGKLVIILCSVAVFFGVWNVQYFPSQSIVEPEGYFTTNEATTTVHDEYLPRWATKQMPRRADKKVEFFMGRGTIKELKVTTQTFDVFLHAEEKSVIQINTIYYPGWGAMLDDRPVQIEFENPFGIMRIPVPEGNHHLYVEFRETPGRFLTDVVSLVSFLLYGISCVVLMVIPKKTEKKSKRKRG